MSGRLASTCPSLMKDGPKSVSVFLEAAQTFIVLGAFPGNCYNEFSLSCCFAVTNEFWHVCAWNNNIFTDKPCLGRAR